MYKREAKAPNGSICVLLRPCFAHCHFAPVKRGDRASPCGRASRPVSSGQVAATRISECARTKTEPGGSLTPPPPLPRHRGHLLVAFLTASINPRGTGPWGHPVSEKVIQTRATATGLPEQEDLRAPLSGKCAAHGARHFNLHLECRDIARHPTRWHRAASRPVPQECSCAEESRNGGYGGRVCKRSRGFHPVRLPGVSSMAEQRSLLTRLFLSLGHRSAGYRRGAANLKACGCCRFQMTLSSQVTDTPRNQASPIGVFLTRLPEERKRHVF